MMRAQEWSSVGYLERGYLERGVTSAWLLTESRFRKTSGHGDLCALATILRCKTETEISQEKVA